MFDCLKNTGKVITVKRPASAFNKIDLQNNVSVIFHQGSNYAIKVTAGANLIDGITTEIKDNILYIKNENKCNWVRDFNNEYVVEVTTDDLVQLTNTGSGDITFEDSLLTYEFFYENDNASGTINLKFKGDRIHVNIHAGTADVTVKGTAGINFLYYNGYGYMNCKDLKAGIVYVSSYGNGDCRVNVEDELVVKITYIGDVFYSGNPHSVNTDITGTGQLIHE